MPTGQIEGILGLGLDIVERVGDCFNIERRVDPNSIFWETISSKGGLTLQKDCFGTRARIIDSNSIQKANGSLTAMREKMGRLTSSDFLRAGDVIGVSRGAYEHYAIYAGKGRVIHYAGETSDLTGRVSIHEAPFENFLKDSTDYFVVSFEGRYPVKIYAQTRFIPVNFFDSRNIKRKRIYSPRETLKRAYSRIGECKYNMISNNCEHFAMWCKTGSAKSTQVRTIASLLLPAPISVFI